MSVSHDDETFSLTQALYQSLKGARAAEAALRDAEAWSNAGLVSFFDEVRTTHLRLAERAKGLLRESLGESTETSKGRVRTTDKSAPKVDQDSMESFPASDAPAHY